VAKAGRVLSAANEARIKSASEALSAVLATLPAPIEDGLAVAKAEEKEPTVTQPTETEQVEKAADEPTAAPEAPEAPAAVEDVAKANKALAICYDANGKAIGLIDPEKLQPIADGATPAAEEEPKDEEPADQPPAAPEPAAPAAPTPEPTPPAAAPAAPAAPDHDVAKSTDTTDPVQLMKAILEGPLTEAIDRAIAPLKERVEKMATQPMPGGPMLNGVEPGQRLPVVPDGSVPANLELAELRKQADAETDPVKKAQMQQSIAEQQMKAVLFGRQ